MVEARSLRADSPALRRDATVDLDAVVRSEGGRGEVGAPANEVDGSERHGRDRSEGERVDVCKERGGRDLARAPVRGVDEAAVRDVRVLRTRQVGAWVAAPVALACDPDEEHAGSGVVNPAVGARNIHSGCSALQGRGDARLPFGIAQVPCVLAAGQRAQPCGPFSGQRDGEAVEVRLNAGAARSDLDPHDCGPWVAPIGAQVSDTYRVNWRRRAMPGRHVSDVTWKVGWRQ